MFGENRRSDTAEVFHRKRAIGAGKRTLSRAVHDVFASSALEIRALLAAIRAARSVLGQTVETAAPSGCRRSAPWRKVERSEASNTLRCGRDKALAPQTRQPAQVLQ